MSDSINYYKYALALTKISKSEKDLENVGADLETFNGFLKQEKDLFKFLKHPGILDSEKEGILDNISEEFKFSSVSKDFIKLLTAEGRVEDLPGITNKYNAILRAKKKEVKVIVEAPYLYGKDELEQIRAVLSKKFGRNITMEFSEQKDLIGGFRLVAEGQVFDCSIKAELEQIQKSLI